MSSLPSFVELMSSLGLEDEASVSQNPPSFLRPRSHSNASSSSDPDDEAESPRHQSAFDGSYLFAPVDYDLRDRDGCTDVDIPRVSRHGKGRYSPYLVASVPRKGSLPALFEAGISGRPKRALSTSPLPSPCYRTNRSPRSPPSGRSSRRGSEAWSHGSDLQATTPISTFVRRKSPQMSPTSATFPRSAFDEPMAPVAIPALPTLLSSFAFPTTPTEQSFTTRDSELPVLMATVTASAD
ncbi:hypothetical protein BC834DRAFT_841821 [Gloeopeniophorella convolvens]|nr:hypothetical protein BC834DRAFT_841821 [Gloeopeniophorella convolvens]